MTKFTLSISVCFFSAPAYAYLDPGSVSLAVQAIIASFAAVALTWNLWYGRLKQSVQKLYFRFQKIKKNQNFDTTEVESDSAPNAKSRSFHDE